MSGKTKNYISLKEAAKISGYHSDYIGYLIRKKRIKSRKIFGSSSWFVNIKELLVYKEKRFKNNKNFLKKPQKIIKKDISLRSKRKAVSLNRGRWKKRRIRRLKSPALIFFILVVIAFVSFTLITKIIKADIANFYPAFCLGGWENPQNAQGKSDLAEGVDASEFNEGNSAVLKNAISQIFCGGFEGEVPKDAEPKKVLLKFSWTIKNENLETRTLDLEELEETPIDISPQPPPESLPEPELLEPELLEPELLEPEPAAPEESEPRPEDSGREPLPTPEPQPNLESPIPTQEENEEFLSSTPLETRAGHETQPSELFTLLSSHSKLRSMFLTGSTFFWQKIFSSAFATENSKSTSTPEITPENIDAFLEVYFTLDSINWQKLGKVGRDNWQRVEFEIPITNWEDLSKIQISLQSLTTFDEQPAVYLDGMWLEVEYGELVEEEFSPEEIEKLPRVEIDNEKIFKLAKKDFQANEEPEFEIDIPSLEAEYLKTEKSDSPPLPESAPTLESLPEQPSPTPEPSPETSPEPSLESAPTLESLPEQPSPTPEPSPETSPEPSLELEPENKIIDFLKKFTPFGDLRFLTGFIPITFAQTSKVKIIKTEVINPKGEKVDVQPIIKETKGAIEINIPKPTDYFLPGKYKMEVEILKGKLVFVLSQEFTWGVMAININKSIFMANDQFPISNNQTNSNDQNLNTQTENGETAYIQMAVLDDGGHTICDANLKLQITNPKSQITILSTENGTPSQSSQSSDGTGQAIQYSGQCGANNVTDVPDYFAYYQVGEPGTYQMKLTNLDNGYEIEDFFEVRDSVPFEVERIGATRINPFAANYTMTLKIKANEDFKGSIIETVPLGFRIENTEYRENNGSLNSKSYILNSSNTQEIIWQANLKNGEETILTYKYKAPEISPQFYLLGPLQFSASKNWLEKLFGPDEELMFQEARQWQIAADLATSNGDGILFYAAASNTTPQWRIYTNSTNDFSANSGTVAGAQPAINQIKTSPTKQEAIAGYQDTSGNLRVLCYDGTSWTEDWTVAVAASGTPTTRRFDIAYETNTGDVTVAYSRNTAAANALAYRTKAGSTGCGTANWAAAANFPTTTTVTSATVMWVKAARDGRSAQNLSAWVWLDNAATNADLGGAIWSGSAFTNFKSIETSMEHQTAVGDSDNFDVQYESLSGDVMVVWGNSAGAGGTNGYRYMTCTGGTSSCTWSALLTMPTTLDDVMTIDLSADPLTDKMAMAGIGGVSFDMSAGYWDGTGPWIGYANVETRTETTVAVGSKKVTTGWLTNGANTKWYISYDDAVGTRLSYKYAINGGAITSPADYTSTPALTDLRGRYDTDMNPFNNAQLIQTVSDDTNGIFAYKLSMDASGNLSWSDMTTAVSLGTKPSHPQQGFSFTYWRFIPAIPTLTQNHYWWRDDTTALNTAGGFLGSQDNSYTSFLKQTTYRLRAEIANTGTAAATGYQYRLQYAAKGGGCAGASYTDVPATATTEHFEMVATDGYINGDNVTVSRLTATGTWANGEAVEDPSNQTESHNLTNDYYTEHEYAIQATTNATTDGLYCFRLNNNGSITNFSYTLYPEATVIVPASPWWNSSWMYRTKLTFTQDSGQSGALSNMPILVVRNSSDTRFWNHVRDDGYDVRFLDDNDSTELQFHFEKFNSTTDDMVAWVEVPSVAAYGTTDFIYMYYGNASASTDPQNAAGTYDTDTYFGAVWHLKETNAVDSTGNGNTGTQTGDPVVTGGQIGDGVDFTPNDWIAVGAGSTINLSDKDVFTIELWANFDAIAADKINFVQSQTAQSWNIAMGIYDNDLAGNNYRFITRDDDGTARDTISGSVPPTGSWHYYVGTYNNGASDYKALYVDGSEVVNTTAGINNLRPSAVSTLIGIGEDDATPFGPMDGKMDEVRLSNTPRSAQWIKAQYLSMTDAFISYGTEQGYGLNHFHFRWRDDNYGLNTNNGWVAAEDAAYSNLAKSTTTRLRVEIPDTGITATGYQYRIGYAVRTGTTCGDESFTAVPVTATTEHFEMVDSLYTNGDDITSGFLTAPTGTWTWTNGKGVEDPSNLTGNFNLSNAYYTEFEYAIQATTNAISGTTYCFQLTNAGSSTNFSYGILPQATIATPPSPTFTQNYYRFYVDNDAVQPTDPWPAGGSNLLQNTPITTSDSPPDDNDLVRIRMSVAISVLNLGAGDQFFKLQYVERADGDCASATGWAAVGAAGSGTIWRGESDATPADGTTLTATLLDPSDVVESYEEENNSVNNPNAVNIGQDGEWDWLIQNNGAVHDTLYCFRMVKSDDTAFTTYTNYPKISTELTTFNSSFESGNGENFTKPYSSTSTQVSFNSELDAGGPLGPCTDWRRQNWFYFSMNNALNQSLQFTLINATASNNENTNWTDHKPVYSYDQVTWYRIASYGSASGSNWVYTFPGGGAKFTSDTVYIAHGIPYTYTDFLTDLDIWDNSSYVTTSTVGNSVQGRPMPLVTIQDTSSPTPASNKKVYWSIARQHPMEPMGSYAIKGVINFLIGSTDEAKLMRRNSIFKIIPMMNPDGVYQGWTTANAEYCNPNREWTSVTPDPAVETDEVYNAHYAINDWMYNGTPADAEVITDFHSRTADPGIYHSNATWYDTDNNENPFEVLWKILDGNDHDDEFVLGVAAGNSVNMYNQYHTATWGNDLEAFNLEGTTYDFVGAAGGTQGTPENAAAFGLSYTKTIWAMKEASSTVFLLTQTDPSGGTTPPQYTVVGSPGQYFAVLNDNTGGGIYNWYDRENDSVLANDLGDATNNVDLLSWNDGVAARTLYGTSNTTLTVDSNSGIRTKFTYTGTLANQTNYNYTLERVIWQDGRLWSKFNFTNNTGGSINWAAMIQGANIDSGDAANSSPLYDNTADPPTQGTDNWFAQMGNGTTLKSSVVGHYVGQTGGWVYDDYAAASDTDGERAYYSDTDGPNQTTGTSIAVNMSYQIRPDTDLMANEAAIDVYRNDIANPDSPTMTSGTFTGFNKQEGGLEFAASGNYVKFTYTNATTYTKKQPVYKVTSYTANTAPILKINSAYLDGETGSAHSTNTHISPSYTSYVDTTNDIAYVQYLNDISTNIPVEIRDTFEEVTQTLTFSISDNTIGFGTLWASDDFFATGDTNGSATEVEAHNIIVGTNASNGYTTTATGTTLTTADSFTINAIGASNTASAPGTEQFGLRMTATGGIGTVSAPYAAAGFALDTAAFPDEVASATGASANTTFSVRYVGNITANTELGSYSATLTYVATAIF